MNVIWLGVDVRTDINRYVVKRDWTLCSKHVSHSKLNSQHGRGICVTTKWARESLL
jgi:hypothetical protein